MLLILHNLPFNTRYADVKSLISDKCGLTDIILDNLVVEGNFKCVTLGIVNVEDAALIVRKINGLYMNGTQLFVENVQQKKSSEQPYRPPPKQSAAPRYGVQQYGSQSHQVSVPTTNSSTIPMQSNYNLPFYMTPGQTSVVNYSNTTQLSTAALPSTPLQQVPFYQQNITSVVYQQSAPENQWNEQLITSYPDKSNIPNSSKIDDSSSRNRDRKVSVDKDFPEVYDRSKNRRSPESYRANEKYDSYNRSRERDDKFRSYKQSPRRDYDRYEKKYEGDKRSHDFRKSSHSGSDRRISNNRLSPLEWRPPSGQASSHDRSPPRGRPHPRDRSPPRDRPTRRSCDRLPKRDFKTNELNYDRSKRSRDCDVNDRLVDCEIEKKVDQQDSVAKKRPHPAENKKNETVPKNPENSTLVEAKLNVGDLEGTNTGFAIQNQIDPNQTGPPVKLTKFTQNEIEMPQNVPYGINFPVPTIYPMIPYGIMTDMPSNTINLPTINPTIPTVNPMIISTDQSALNSTILTSTNVGPLPINATIPADNSIQAVPQSIKERLIKHGGYCEVAVNFLCIKVLANTKIGRISNFKEFRQILKERLRSRLDMILGDKITDSSEEIVDAYRSLFNADDDLELCKIVMEQLQHNEETSAWNAAGPSQSTNINYTAPTNYQEVQINQQTTVNQKVFSKTPFNESSNQPTSVNYTESTNNPEAQINTGIQNDFSETPFHQTYNPNIKVIETQQTSNKSKDAFIKRVLERIPKYVDPNTLPEKQREKVKKVEFDVDVYELPPILQEAVFDELNKLSNVFVSACGESINQDEEVIRQKILTNTFRIFRKVTKNHIIKRLLDIKTENSVSVTMSAFPKMPQRGVLDDFLRAAGITGLRKQSGARNFIATCDSYDSYDKLLALKSTMVGDVELVFKAIDLTDSSQNVEWNIKNKTNVHNNDTNLFKYNNNQTNENVDQVEINDKSDDKHNKEVKNPETDLKENEKIESEINCEADEEVNNLIEVNNDLVKKENIDIPEGNDFDENTSNFVDTTDLIDKNVKQTGTLSEISNNSEINNDLVKKEKTEDLVKKEKKIEENDFDKDTTNSVDTADLINTNIQQTDKLSEIRNTFEINNDLVKEENIQDTTNSVDTADFINKPTEQIDTISTKSILEDSKDKDELNKSFSEKSDLDDEVLNFIDTIDISQELKDGDINDVTLTETVDRDKDLSTDADSYKDTNTDSNKILGENDIGDEILNSIDETDIADEDLEDF